MSAINDFLISIMTFVAGLQGSLLDLINDFMINLTTLNYYIIGVSDVFEIAFGIVPAAYLYAFLVTVTGTILYRLFRSNWGA